MLLRSTLRNARQERTGRWSTRSCIIRIIARKHDGIDQLGNTGADGWEGNIRNGNKWTENERRDDSSSQGQGPVGSSCQERYWNFKFSKSQRIFRVAESYWVISELLHTWYFSHMTCFLRARQIKLKSQSRATLSPTQTWLNCNPLKKTLNILNQCP